MISHLARRAEELRSLHVPGDPVILPNVWDAASAATMVEAGFAAVATSSGAVAESLGHTDGEDAPPDEVFAAIGRIARAVDVPVTADIERGYGLDPAEIARRLADAGAAGCNLEDSVPQSRKIVAVDEQMKWLAAIREAAEEARLPLVLNARIDVYLRKWGEPAGRFDDATRRARLYFDSGADCVYPIGLVDRIELERFVDVAGGPVNAICVPGGPGPAELAEAGVARITFGGGLHRVVLQRLAETAAMIRSGASPY